MVDKKNNANSFANFIYCLGSLERKNSQLFNELANKTVLIEAKSHLLKLSQGNDKQSKVLIDLSNKLGTSRIKSHECKLKLRPVCKITESLIDQIQKKKKITAKELSNVLSTLELQGGSTQYLFNQLRTFIFMSKEISQLYGIHLEDFNNQIMELAQQVEEHIELLELIKTKISQIKNKKTDVYNPVFKYQTPDAWITPISGRED